MNGPTQSPKLRSAVYVGHVMHRRTGPITHRFRYRVFALCIDLDELPKLAQRIPFFSYNRWNLLGFHDRDHGARDGGDLKSWAHRQLRSAGIERTPSRIRLLCYPRMFGFVFNPLSVWFCEDECGYPFAILYEVSNTFGDSYTYAMAIADSAPGGSIEQGCSKALYVSPFFPVAGSYRFRVRAPDDRLALAILYRSPDGSALYASQTGRRSDFSARALMTAIATHPLMSLKVIAGIHWEALRIWFKGARFHRRPGTVAPDAIVGTGNARTATGGHQP
jgi:DUF1365 family protein